MRELAPAARGSQDAGSRNLVFTFHLSTVCPLCCRSLSIHDSPRGCVNPGLLALSGRWCEFHATSWKEICTLECSFVFHSSHAIPAYVHRSTVAFFAPPSDTAYDVGRRSRVFFIGNCALPPSPTPSLFSVLCGGRRSGQESTRGAQRVEVHLRLQMDFE